MRLIVLIAILNFGCVHVTKQEKLNARMQSWVGEKEIALVERWGVADGSQNVDEQNKVLTYAVNERGFSWSPVPFASGSYEKGCKANFTISKESGAVLRGFWEGDIGKCMKFIKEGPNGLATDLAH